MSADSSLIGFAEAVVRAITSAGNPSLLTQSLQEAWHLFRHLSSDDQAVELLHHQGGLHVRLEGRAPAPILGSLSEGDRQRTLRMVGALFGRAQIKQLTFLPGLSWKELGTAVPLIVGSGDQARFKLGQHHVYRVLCLGQRPVLQINRQVSLTVAENLDMFYVAIQGVNRFGAGPGDTPRDILTRTARYLIGRLSAAEEARAFLASLDLAMRNLPQPLQNNALVMLSSVLPTPWLSELAQSCESAVDAAGGPRAIGQNTDPAGIPLMGYYVVGRSVREEMGRRAQSQASADGWGRFTPGQGPTRSGEHTPTQPATAAGRETSQPISGMRQTSQSLRRGGRSQPEHNPPPSPSSALRANSQSLGGRTSSSGLHRIQRTSSSGVHRLGGAAREASGLIQLRRGQTQPGERSEASGLIRLARGPASQRTTESGAFGLGGNRPKSNVQRALDPRVDSWMASFEKVGRRLLDKAENVADSESYIGAVKIVSNVGGHLLDEERWATALPIVRLLKCQELIASEWPEQQRQALAEALGLVLPSQGVAVMVQALPEADFLDRLALLEYIAFYGEKAAPALIQLATTRRLTGTLKKEVTACIEALGTAAGPALLDAISKHGRKWNRVAPLIATLGAVGYRDGQRRVLEFLRHPQPKLREEALVAAYKILGDKSQRYLLSALDDPDAGVCQTAVALLAAKGSSERTFTSLIADLIDIDAPEDAREEGLIITAIQGLRDLGNIRLRDKITAESALVSALKEAWGGGLLSRIGGKAGRSPGVLTAICETLGEIGSVKARAVLSSVPRDVQSGVRDAAQQALTKIGSRQVGAA